MRITKFLLIITAFIAVAYGYKTHFGAGFEPPDPEPFLHTVIPASSSFDEAHAPSGYRYFRALGPGGEDLGVAFVTTELAPGIRGYSGPVPVLVGLRPDGSLNSIKMLDNNETPSYSARVKRPAFTDGFKDKPITDGFVLDEDLDGVSRATVTAKAVADGVRESSRIAASDLYGMRFERTNGPGYAFLSDPGFYLVSGLFVVSLYVFLASRTRKDTGRLRWAVLAGAFGVIGVYKAAPVSVANYFSLAAFRLPGAGSAAWYVLVVGGLVTAVLWGRQYCGYLCPFGALQEFISRLPIPKVRLKDGIDRRARYIKYGLLWLLVIAAFYTGLIEMGAFEPFGTLFAGAGGVAAWSLVAVSLVGALVLPRFWCRYLCPVGALHGACASVAPLGMKSFEGCTSCGACEGVCTMDNRRGGEAGFKKSECIGCGACVRVCPERGGRGAR